MPGPSYFFYCFPWDVEEEGVDDALARLRGEIGVDTVCVAAVGPGVAQVRPRSPGGRHTRFEPAAAFFQPAARHYPNTRLRPPAAGWLKGRNPLEKIASAAERQGLALRVSVACCDNQTLVERHSMASCVDVFATPNPRRLCPSNPEVREYVAALAEDLTANYPTATLELDDLGFDVPATQGADRYLRPDVGGASHHLLAWCFCASCRNTARQSGIDADEVAARVRERFGRALRLELPPQDSLDEFLAAEPAARAYGEFRRRSVGALVAAIRARARGRLIVGVTRRARITGLDFTTIAASCDGLILDHPTRRDALSYGAAAETELLPEDSGRTELRLSPYPPAFAAGPALVAAVHPVASAGYAAIGFDDYGSTPAPCLEWIRQAVRYARRESRAISDSM